MELIGHGRWRKFERWSATAFLVGVVMFVVTAGFNAADVVGGSGHMRLPLKQAFVGAGWTAGLIGLLGMYPKLADRSRWLVRAGAVFTVIGIIGYAVMTVVSLAVFTGILEGSLDSFAPMFLPPVLVGSVLTFPLFSVVSLRSDALSRTLGLLLLGPSIIFVVNVLTPTPPSVVLGIVSGLSLVYFAIGYRLRTETGPTGRGEPAPGPTTE